MSGEEYAECAHGSDDRLSCFGCQFAVGIGPKTLAEMFPKQRKIRYEPSFVKSVRELTGNHRFPLKAVHPPPSLPAQPHRPKESETMSEPVEYVIEDGWLVERIDRCTCSPHFGAHERHCGVEPVGKVEDVLAAYARSADMEARIRALVEELRTSRAPDETRQSIKLRAALASRLAALLDAAPAGGAEAVDQEGHEIYWDGLGWTHVNRLLRGQCPAIPATLDAPSEAPHD